MRLSKNFELLKVVLLMASVFFLASSCGNRSGNSSDKVDQPVAADEGNFPAALLEESLSPLPPIMQQPKWEVKNGVVVANGGSFFPLGIYYVSHYPQQKEQRLKDLELIAGAGFNMIHTPIDQNDRNFLDKCARLGIYAVVEFNYPPDLVVSLFKDHPAVAFWSTFDDVDSQTSIGVQKHSPEHVKEVNAQIKRSSPNVLTYISGGFPTRIGRYVGASELLGFQVYPVPEEALHSVTLGYLRPTVNAIGGTNQALVGNLQSFAWPGKRFPTVAEFRNMTYQALIAGVKGIIYYAFFDSVTDLNQQPEFWQGIVQVVREIRAIENFLVRGQKTFIDTGKDRSFSASWDHGGKRLVILADADTQEVIVSLN